MAGKILLFEGTDCSGKQTQSDLLIDYLKSEGIDVVKFAFPDYESPTGKIVGGPYLGKDYICDGWFPEGAPNVSPKVSALYYAADFLYHVNDMKEVLASGKWIVLDRYFYSTLAHQGGKEKDREKRIQLYNWFTKLFFEVCELPDPDIKLFLHMPYECSVELKANRAEKPDQNEASEEHLRQAELAYTEIASTYGFNEIICGEPGNIKTVEEIHDEVKTLVKRYI